MMSLRNLSAWIVLLCCVGVLPACADRRAAYEPVSMSALGLRALDGVYQVDASKEPCVERSLADAEAMRRHTECQDRQRMRQSRGWEIRTSVLSPFLAEEVLVERLVRLFPLGLQEGEAARVATTAGLGRALDYAGPNPRLMALWGEGPVHNPAMESSDLVKGNTPVGVDDPARIVLIFRYEIHDTNRLKNIISRPPRMLPAWAVLWLHFDVNHQLIFVEYQQSRMKTGRVRRELASRRTWVVPARVEAD